MTEENDSRGIRLEGPPSRAYFVAGGLADIMNAEGLSPEKVRSQFERLRQDTERLDREDAFVRRIKNLPRIP